MDALDYKGLNSAMIKRQRSGGFMDHKTFGNALCMPVDRESLN